MNISIFQNTVQQSLLVFREGFVQFYYATKERIIEILKSPVTNPDMLWLLVPLVLALILLEFYFGRYKEEELGWNTAFENAIALIFIALILAKNLYDYRLFYDINKISAVASILLVGIILAFLDFYHALPKKIAFELSAKLPVDFLAYVAIIFVFTDIPPDGITAVAFFILLVGLLILIWVIYAISPKVKSIMLSDPPAPKKDQNQIQ
jgi:hypothetical protein